MIAKIVDRLKQGQIKNVVPYGSDRPAPPYVIVADEPDATDRGREVRVWVHFSKGQQIFLDDYVYDAVPALLSDYISTDRQGNHFEILDQYYVGPLITNNDDGTISKERRFLVPGRIF